MILCTRCGQHHGGAGDVCDDCLRDQNQPTATFAPVGNSGQVVPAEPVAGGVQPRFVVVKGPQMGDYFALDPRRTTIGRNPKASIFLNDQTVSREHAEVISSGIMVLIRDLGSLNGTYVNGLIVDEAELKDGDIVQIGTFQLAFRNGTGS